MLRTKNTNDNMNYRADKEKLQEENRIEKVDVFNLKDYFKYKDAIKNDKNLKDVFPPNYPVRELEIFQKLLNKEQDEG